VDLKPLEIFPFTLSFVEALLGFFSRIGGFFGLRAIDA
jgi:hypothetical protein